jgi:hypothetical protein
LSTNTHTFTGSINVSGSANFSGSLTVNGTATLGTGTSSYTFGGGSAAAGNLTDKDLTLKAWSPISGVNEYAGDLILQSGVGTGNASGKLGSVIIKVGTDGATSSTLGTYNTIATFTKAGIGIGTSTPGSLLSLEKAKAGSGVESLDMLTLRITGTTAIGDALNVKFLNGTNVNVATISGILGGDNVAYGTLSFSTRNYYTDSLVEALRITSRGRVIVNSSTDRAYSFQVNGDSNSYACEIRQSNNNANYDLLTLTHEATSGNRRMVIFNTGGYGTVGTIISTNSSTTYNTSSDYRLKEDLQDFNGLEKVSAIKVYDFKWKNLNERTNGVLAHELAEVLPYAVSGIKDALNHEGKIEAQSVDYSKLTPVLVKAIQELTARVQELENK